MCRLVCTRSARLTAAAIAGVLKRMGHPAGAGAGAGAAGGSEAPAPPRVVVAFDGSVFAKYAQYRRVVLLFLLRVRGRQAGDAIGIQPRQGWRSVQTCGACPCTSAMAQPRAACKSRVLPPRPLTRRRERLRAALEEVCGRAGADSISLQLVQDGSVLGAAFLAVAAAQWEAQHGGGAGKA